MITAALIALAALAAACIATILMPPGAAVAVLWAVALWAGRRAHARYYHRHRYEHPKCHAKPTLAHRARVGVRRLRSVRIQMNDTTRRATA